MTSSFYFQGNISANHTDEKCNYGDYKTIASAITSMPAREIDVQKAATFSVKRKKPPQQLANIKNRIYSHDQFQNPKEDSGFLNSVDVDGVGRFENNTHVNYLADEFRKLLISCDNGTIPDEIASMKREEEKQAESEAAGLKLREHFYQIEQEVAVLSNHNA